MMTKNILILGGTREARQLADHAAKAGWSAVFSLAGITATPFKTPLPMRYGGFGGAKGLAEWVVSHAITHLVDTTHPYAANISANAVEAARLTGIKRLTLWRPEWQAEAEDDWHQFSTLKDLFQSIPDEAHLFLAAGQEGINALPYPPRFRVTARALEQPETAHPITFIKALPASNPNDEAALFQLHNITHLAVKNAGGSASRAKLIAARQMGLPVFMLARPDPPPPPLYPAVDALINALTADRDTH